MISILPSRNIWIGFRSDLENRATAHLHPWYELQQPQEGIYYEFAHPKIIMPDFARSVRFMFDSDGHYIANTCYFIPGASKWLLAFMNSSLFEFLLCQITNTPPGGFLKLHTEYTSRLPIVSPDEGAKAELESLANEILEFEDSSERAKAIEREMDSLVFHVYGLSAPERKLVLDWLDERSVAPDGDAVGPERSKLNALRATVGAWKGSVDGDELIKDIYASRLIDTRPEPRL